MALNVGCLIRPKSWRDKLKRSSPSVWLSKLDIPTTQEFQTELSNDHLNTPTQIVILERKQSEIWLGLGVFTVFNALCQTDNFKGLGSGVVLVAEDTSGFYGLQEFFNDQPGWGGQVITSPPRTWNRALPEGALEKLPKETRAAAFGAIATLLNTDAFLIECAITGMNSKGRYGIAWHGEKQDWVLALRGSAGPGQFQELDQETYSRIGVPFDGAENPDGWPSYWRQNDLFAAVQDHLSRAWCGLGLSEMTADHPALAGPCTVLDISTHD